MMKIVLSAILFYSIVAFAIRDNFRMVDGQTYYQVLGVSNKADYQNDIKPAYKKLIMKYHPDRNNGDDTMAKLINEANDALKNQTTRSRYDHWLLTASSSYKKQADQKTEAEIRKERCQQIVDAIKEATEEHLAERPQTSLDQMTRIAEQIILYHVRYFPMAQMKNSDLYHLFAHYSMNDSTLHGRIYSQKTLIVLASAVIRILEERAYYNSVHGNEAREYLNAIAANLEHWLNSKALASRGYAKYADEIWKLWKGQSYFTPPPPPPQSPNSCETHLRATFTDQYGNTYEVPIRIEIKIGIK